jgi:hypothetical protein
MRICCLFLLAVAAFAQETGFSVDGQGRVWFATGLRPRGAGPQYCCGVYSVAESLPRSEAGEWYQDLPRFTSDGHTAYWTRTSYVRGWPNGRLVLYTGTVLRRTPFGETLIKHDGAVGISRNGEWAVWSTNHPEYGEQRTLWVNLVTREEITVPGLDVSTESIASDGSVIGVVNGYLTRFTPHGTPDIVRTGKNVARVILSADARRLLYFSAEGRLNLYDRESRKDTYLGSQCEKCTVGALSSDGRFAAFVLSPALNEVVLYDADTDTKRTLPAFDGNVAALQLSDDGTTLWVKTVAFAFLRIDLGSGETRVVMPPTPIVTRIWRRTTPAGRTRINVAGLASVTSVRIGTQPVQIVGRGPGWLQVYVPDTVGTGQAQWFVDSPDSPFEAPGIQDYVFPQFPQFLILEDLGETDPVWASRPVAFGAADGGLLNFPDRLAVAGEEVMFWMTGIGRHVEPIRFMLNFPTAAGKGVEDLSNYTFTPDAENPGWWILRFRLPTSVATGYAELVSLDGSPVHVEKAGIYLSSGGNSSNESSR